MRRSFADDHGTPAAGFDRANFDRAQSGTRGLTRRARPQRLRAPLRAAIGMTRREAPAAFAGAAPFGSFSAMP